MLVIEDAEIILSLQEGFQDGEARLHVYLAPLVALRIPAFHREHAGARHGEVGGVEDIARFAMDIDGAVAVTEDGEEGEFAGEGHGDAFGAAFLVGAGGGAEEGGVGFVGFVVGRDRL